jgi:hypothetical protein
VAWLNRLETEVGNLGALVWHMKNYGFGSGLPRPWPDHIHLGSWLSAASGMLNVCLMIQAHLLARSRSRESRAATVPAIQVVAAWLVPGLGHFLQRRFVRGTAVFVLLVGLFALGTVLAEGSNLDPSGTSTTGAGSSSSAPAMWPRSSRPRSRDARHPYVDAGLVMVASPASSVRSSTSSRGGGSCPGIAGDQPRHGEPRPGEGDVVKDLPVHLLLFAIVGIVITGLNAVFAEPDDARALRNCRGGSSGSSAAAVSSPC